MKSQASKKSLGPVLLGIAAVLFCLVLISTAMMSGLYARYVSRGIGNDSARVAAFAVGADLSPEDVTVDLSQNVSNGTYTLTTENNSEVAVRYDVIVTADLPNGIDLTIDGKAPTSSVGNTYTFSNLGEFPSSNGTPVQDSHTLEFEVDVTDFTSAATGESYTQTISFDIKVRFVQID